MKNELETKVYCAECGSTNVQIMAWVNANTNDFCSLVNDPPESEDCWCDNCEEHVDLLTLPQLWERFGEIPVNNDDEIEEDFLNFPARTSKFDVWHWFDDRCPNSLAEDLMGETNN